MYIDFKRVLSVTAILVVGVLLGIAGVLTYQRLKAPKQLITVTGSAEVDAQTDQVNISVQVKNTGTTQEAAQTANKKDVDSLKKTLADLGIPESRITQSTYSQAFYGETDAMMAPPDFRPYPTTATVPTVVTNLSIVLNSIENIDAVIAAISKSPNAQITSTYYSLNNQKEWEAKAKEEALKDARRQIEQIAKTNKLKVGKLTYLRDLNDGGGVYPMPAYDKGVMESKGTSSSDEPTETGVAEENMFYGEQTVKITASYQARYELY